MCLEVSFLTNAFVGGKFTQCIRKLQDHKTANNPGLLVLSVAIKHRHIWSLFLVPDMEGPKLLKFSH